MAEIPRLTILTGRLPVDVAKNLKSHGWANSELAIPKDLPGCGEIQEKSPIQSGDFRHPPIYIERATYLGFRQNPKIIRVGKYRIRPSERPPVFWRYRRGGRNSQEDQTEDATARGFRQNHKIRGCARGGFELDPRWAFRVLAKSEISRPPSLEIPAAPKILSARQKSAD